MKHNTKIAAAGCIVLIIGQMVWAGLNLPHLYYWCDAAFKVALLYSYSRILKDKAFGAFIFFDFMFNLAISNFVDEVLFDPELVQVNEYVAFVATAIIAIFRWLSHATNLKPLNLLKQIFWHGTT